MAALISDINRMKRINQTFTFRTAKGKTRPPTRLRIQKAACPIKKGTKRDAFLLLTPMSSKALKITSSKVITNPEKQKERHLLGTYLVRHLGVELVRQKSEMSLDFSRPKLSENYTGAV